jgi:hypothetical protein
MKGLKLSIKPLHFYSYIILKRNPIRRLAGGGKAAGTSQPDQLTGAGDDG